MQALNVVLYGNYSYATNTTPVASFVLLMFHEEAYVYVNYKVITLMIYCVKNVHLQVLKFTPRIHSVIIKYNGLLTFY
jgi:hypothetical protein